MLAGPPGVTIVPGTACRLLRAPAQVTWSREGVTMTAGAGDRVSVGKGEGHSDHQSRHSLSDLCHLEKNAPPPSHGHGHGHGPTVSTCDEQLTPSRLTVTVRTRNAEN